MMMVKDRPYVGVRWDRKQEEGRDDWVDVEWGKYMATSSWVRPCV